MNGTAKFHQSSFSVGSTSSDAQNNYRDNFEKTFLEQKYPDPEKCVEHGITREFCAKCRRAAAKR